MFVSIASLGALSLCVGCVSVPTGYESPQAAFDAFVAADRARQWEVMYDALTPSSQQEKIALQLADCQHAIIQLATTKEMAGKVEASDDRLSKMIEDMQTKADKLRELLETHNVELDDLPEGLGQAYLSDDWPEVFPDVAAIVPDPKPFYIDFLETTKTYKAKTEPSEKDQKLQDLTVDGDVARGTLSGGVLLVGNSPIEFRKIDGGWFVHTADLTRQHLSKRILELQEDL